MRLYRPLEQWRSRSTFLLALCAVALGMGNWWRFAWLLGENGGAPFMLTYVLALLLLAVPLLAAELTLGQIGRRSPLVSVGWIAALSGRSGLWPLLALVPMLAALGLASIALLLGGWALSYAYHQQLGSFAAISLLEAGEFFTQLTAQPARSVGWQFLAVCSLLLAAAAGVRRGLGLAVWLALPLLCVLLAVLVDFAIAQGDLEQAAAYLFARQPLDFNGRSVALAFMQAFFTLAIGAAIGMSFGASAHEQVPPLRSALAVAVFDTATSIAIAVSILALCFAVNLQPGEGVGMLFVGLPYAFGNVSMGDFHGALFFFALFVAAMAVALALLESLVAVLTQQLRLSRVRAALLVVGTVWCVAVLCIYSLAPGNSLAGFLPRLQGWSADLLLGGALLLAVFVGWRVPRPVLRRQLCREPDFLFALWYLALRFAVPPAIVLAWFGVRLLP